MIASTLALFGILTLVACGDKGGGDTGGTLVLDGGSGDGGSGDGGDTDGGAGDGGADGGSADGGSADGGSADGGSADGGSSGGDTTIFELQDGSIAIGTKVVVEDVVVTSPNTGYGFFVGEPEGGAGSGVWVYTGTELKIDVAQGDLVDITGVLTEYEDSAGGGSLTELVIGAVEDVVVTGTAALPSPVTVATTALADPKRAESYEGVLIRVEEVEVTEPVDGSGEWQVDGILAVDDLFYRPKGLVVGDTFEAITGILSWSYGQYELEPRGADDLEGFSPVGCAAEACVRDLVDGALVITEFAIDVQTGPDDCEWVEIYNASGVSVDLNGLVFGDDDPGIGTVDGELVVDAGAFVVLGANDPETWAIECPELNAVLTPAAFYGGSVSISNSGDPLRIARPDGSAIDEVPDYGSGPDAWQLDATFLDAVNNDDPEFWCEPTTVLVTDDTNPSLVDHGTPGSANTVCL